MEEMDSNACVYSTSVKRLFMDEIITGRLRQAINNLQPNCIFHGEQHIYQDTLKDPSHACGAFKMCVM